MVGTLVVAAAKLLAYYWRAALAAAQPRAGLACCVLPASPPHILIYGNFIYFPLLALLGRGPSPRAFRGPFPQQAGMKINQKNKTSKQKRGQGTRKRMHLSRCRSKFGKQGEAFSFSLPAVSDSAPTLLRPEWHCCSGQTYSYSIGRAGRAGLSGGPRRGLVLAARLLAAALPACYELTAHISRTPPRLNEFVRLGSSHPHGKMAERITYSVS